MHSLDYSDTTKPSLFKKIIPFSPSRAAQYRMKKHYEYFESTVPGFENNRRRFRYYWNEITEYCNYFSDDSLSVLEVGCSTGDLLAGLKARRRVGVDFSPGMIAAAREKYPDIRFEVMEAETLTFEETFDLIIISNLVGHLEDVQEVFEELHRVCHERTKIIITYYNFLWEPILRGAEWLGVKPRTPNQNWLSRGDISNLLRLAGFDVYRTSSQTLLPVRIPLVSGICNRYIAKLPLFNLLCVNEYVFARPQIGAADDRSYKKRYSVSVVIPARNESGNIENALKRMPDFGQELEIIFVEGNSTDDTWNKIQEAAREYSDTFSIKTLQQDGKGKADAVRKGFEHATGDILMILDADLTVPPEDLPKFYDALASGKGDFINGSRLVYAMEKEAMRSLNLLGNKFFSVLFSWLLDRPFKDTLCGTKVMFRKDYLRLVKNRSFFGEFDPFGDYDLIFGAFKLNLKIVELPIRYRERTYGTTNISRFKHGLILLKMCAFAARKIKFV